MTWVALFICLVSVVVAGVSWWRTVRLSRRVTGHSAVAAWAYRHRLVVTDATGEVCWDMPLATMAKPLEQLDSRLWSTVPMGYGPIEAGGTVSIVAVKSGGTV